MWIILLVMLAFLVLDRTKVLQCNTLFMTIVYVVGIPFLLCGYLVALPAEILSLVADFTMISCVKLAVNFMLALPMIIFLIYVLIKICRAPIERKRFSGSDEDYNIACVKRQRTVMWTVYPLLWLCAVAAMATGVKILITAAGATLLTFNPVFALLTIFTFGIFMGLYVIVVVGYMSATIAACLLASLFAGFFMIITVAMAITALYRMRKISGFSKGKNCLLVLSMFVPVWGLISLIEISMKIRSVTAQKEYVSCQ